jgi:hypothetical protein
MQSRQSSFRRGGAVQGAHALTVAARHRRFVLVKIDTDTAAKVVAPDWLSKAGFTCAALIVLATFILQAGAILALLDFITIP